MTKQIFKAICFLALSVILVSSMYAQRQTGSLEGKIVDEEENALPGVSLTLSSPALMGTRTFVTTDTGHFRFPSLSPGVYTIVCELSGFQTVTRSGLIVSVGKGTTIILTLTQTALEEEVTVTAATPVVDVRSSKIGVTYTQELVQNLPMNRSLDALMHAMPGVTRDPAYSGFIAVHGSDVSQNIIAFDGQPTEDPLMRWRLTTLDFNMIDEIETQVGGHPAEVGSAAGAYINVVTKSGGNKFHGAAEAYYFNESFVDRNFSQEQLVALGLGSPSFDKRQNDLSVSLGGPILNDRLWFFLSGRYADRSSEIAGFPLDYEYSQWFGLGKLTFQLRNNIKLMALYNRRTAAVPMSVPTNPARTSIEATRSNDYTWDIYNAQLNWVLSPNAFLDVRGNYLNRWYDFQKHPDATFQKQDVGTGEYLGGINFEQDLEMFRVSGQVAFTLFLDNTLGGNHEWKFGVEYEYAGFNHAGWNDQPVTLYMRNGTPYYFGGNVGYFLAWGVPPEKAVAARWRTSSFSAFVQDSWTIQDRLTLNLGLRFDSSSGSLPSQAGGEAPYWSWLDPVFFGRKDYDEFSDLIKWNDISPRLSLVYDIFGTGKTVAKTSFSRYRDYLQVGYIYYMNGNAAYSYQVYQWIDNDLNQTWNPADTFVRISQVGRQDVPARDMVDPNVKAPFYNEFILGLDHELAPNFRLGLNYVHKWHQNIYEGVRKDSETYWNVPMTSNEPGFDGVFGTGDDGQIQLFDRSGPQQGLFWQNVDDLKRKYHGLELTLEKRMSNNWQFIGSIIYSKAWGNINLGYDASIGLWQNIADTPNYFVNRDGRLDLDRPLVIKLQGTYRLPYGIIFSGYFIHSSGVPWARTVSVWAPGHGNYVPVRAEESGSRRRASYNNLDLRLEKEFRISDFGRLGLYVDVQNATNSALINVNTANQGFIEADGSFRPNANWLQVTGVSSPRLIRLGLRFTF